MIPQAKQKIADAMKKLMLRKSVHQIRVIEICGEAGVGRQSFYYHFQDKHDLLAWMFLQTMGDLDIISVPAVIAALERMKQDYYSSPVPTRTHRRRLSGSICSNTMWMVSRQVRAPAWASMSWMSRRLF